MPFSTGHPALSVTPAGPCQAYPHGVPEDRTFSTPSPAGRGWRRIPLTIGMVLLTVAALAFVAWVTNPYANVQRFWQMALTGVCSLLGLLALGLAKR